MSISKILNQYDSASGFFNLPDAPMIYTCNAVGHLANSVTISMFLQVKHFAFWSYSQCRRAVEKSCGIGLYFLVVYSLCQTVNRTGFVRIRK